MDIGAKEIRRWHKNKGWSDIGYHYVIRLDGTREQGRSIDIQGAHAYGFNKKSIGICIVGGVDENMKPLKTINIAQEEELALLITEIDWSYPNIDIKGHNELSTKACPSFDVQDWLKESGYKN
jgi:N-acetyl-anhydromuramyl-L-alanine amidase AmpD